jgi:hypothetical protein
MQRLMSVLFVAVAACGGGDGGAMTGLPDASSGADDAPGVSDAQAFQGLTLAWNAMPVLPGSVSSIVTVTSVKFHVDKLEVISDAGDPTDTTRRDFDLLWTATSPGPEAYSFFSAPPAIYSKIRMNIDKGASNAPSVEILGTTTANGAAEPFKITSIKKLDLEITGYNLMLHVGEAKMITCDVGVDAGLANISWGNLPTTSNVRTLDDSAPNTQAMDAFFGDLEDVFTAPEL